MAFGRVHFAAASLCLLGQAIGAVASSFLSRAQNADLKDLTADMEMSILEEIEGVISEGRGMDDARLTQLQELLRTTFLSMPKNEHGNLGHVAVRYVLHSYFVQRHAWSVRGLGGGTSRDEGASTLQDKMQEFVQGAFERRLGAKGLNLHELAVLAATYENLIHTESMHRLNHTMRLLFQTQRHEFSVSAVDDILDVYMMGYIMNLNFTRLAPNHVDVIKKHVDSIYPEWNETRSFLRDVRQRRSMGIHYFSRVDVESMLEAVNDEYGRWQNSHCVDLKTKLLALEDRSIGFNGSGRVRLTDFYRSALHEGNWQFSESREYLAQVGALDNYDPSIPRVVIPNYIAGPGNCLASSKFYAVCCISECEDLMEHIEHRFAAPAASPDDVLGFVSQLSSSSVAAGRVVQPALVERLTDIASHHGGVVPIHGRLFAQWMHHAYPRECPYPHVSGTTKLQSPQDFAEEHNLVPVATKAEMQEIVATMKDVDGISGDDVTVWTHHEELYTSDHVSVNQYRKRPVWVSLRPIVYACALVAALSLVWRALPATKCVAKLSGACGGKDVFV